MLRINIRHQTTYEYTAPVRFGQHQLVLRPREGHDQRIGEMRLSIEPAHAVTWVRDIYGNSIGIVDFLKEASRLDIVSEVAVERFDFFPEKRLHEPWSVKWPVVYDERERTLSEAYLVPSYPADQREIREWHHLQGTFAYDAEGLMLALCERVHSTIKYRRRLETGVQSPAETLRLTSGSCRDMATLLMDLARALGVASRFVSGYLHGTASMAGHASTHAWSEVYLPALGWRGFDPTTGAAVGLHHIATGVSQHPRGVMPVSGSFNGTMGKFLNMRVQVATTVA
ncbi:MAG: transglutaminase family protein [Steroidobacteraceae bacterium]